jgi:hypothetical protein
MAPGLGRNGAHRLRCESGAHRTQPLPRGAATPGTDKEHRCKLTLTIGRHDHWGVHADGGR